MDSSPSRLSVQRRVRQIYVHSDLRELLDTFSTVRVCRVTSHQVIVMYYSPSCRACEDVAPALERIACNATEIAFCKIDVGSLKLLASQADILSTVCMLLSVLQAAYICAVP